MEQALYQEEGITIPGTAFVDNQPTLDLLEAKAVGIFSMCDEEINVPRGSDEGFLTKVLQKHGDGKHPNCIRPKAKDCKDFLKNFGILHYAGPVFYNVGNFLEKNKDQLHPDITNVLRSSSSTMVSSMFPAEVESSGAGNAKGKAGAKSKMTLGGQFKAQLNELIATLNSTFPHFVRCMKSNDKKVCCCSLSLLLRVVLIRWLFACSLATFLPRAECRISYVTLDWWKCAEFESLVTLFESLSWSFSRDFAVVICSVRLWISCSPFLLSAKF